MVLGIQRASTAVSLEVHLTKSCTHELQYSVPPYMCITTHYAWGKRARRRKRSHLGKHLNANVNVLRDAWYNEQHNAVSDFSKRYFATSVKMTIFGLHTYCAATVLGNTR